MPAPASLPNDIPAPDARLLLWRVSMMAVIDAMPRRRGERMLRTIAKLLAEEEAMSQVFPIRPDTRQADEQQARRTAFALFRVNLPAFLGMLDRK